MYRCPRAVSTILCVHEPECDPPNCNNHGECVMGECHCHGNWETPRCDKLDCGLLNCSNNGLCTEGKTDALYELVAHLVGGHI